MNQNFKTMFTDAIIIKIIEQSCKVLMHWSGKKFFLKIAVIPLMKIKKNSDKQIVINVNPKTKIL